MPGSKAGIRCHGSWLAGVPPAVDPVATSSAISPHYRSQWIVASRPRWRFPWSTSRSGETRAPLPMWIDNRSSDQVSQQQSNVNHQPHWNWWSPGPRWKRLSTVPSSDHLFSTKRDRTRYHPPEPLWACAERFYRTMLNPYHVMDLHDYGQSGSWISQI